MTSAIAPAAAPVPDGPITAPASAASSIAGSDAAIDADDTNQRPAHHSTARAETASGRTIAPKRATAPEAVVTSAATPVSKAAGPAPEVTAPTPLPAPAPTPAPRPIAKTTTTQGIDDDTLALAGAGGVGIVLLAGGAFALSRRKRRDGEGEMVYETIEPEATPAVVMVPASAPIAPAPMAPAMAATASALPDGFDISRFGPHVQAAYRGPTEDNPSLSLKARLKRAAFYDRRERLAAETGMAPAPATTAAETIGAKAPVAHQDKQIVYRPRKLSKGGGFRPAFRTSPA
jgi:hypothetical protein